MFVLKLLLYVDIVFKHTLPPKVYVQIFLVILKMSICPSNGLYELQHRGTNIDMQVLVYNTQVDLFLRKKNTITHHFFCIEN